MAPPRPDASPAELLAGAFNRLEHVEWIVSLTKRHTDGVTGALLTDASDWLDEAGQLLVALGHDLRGERGAA
jgi:hypothetical protein